MQTSPSARSETGLGRRLRELRESWGEAQLDVARILDVSRAAISQYENDVIAPRGAKARQLANHFGVSLEWLLLGTGTPPEAPTPRRHTRYSISDPMRGSALPLSEINSIEEINRPTRWAIPTHAMNAQSGNIRAYRIPVDHEPLRASDYIFLDTNRRDLREIGMFLVELDGVGPVTVKSHVVKNGSSGKLQVRCHDDNEFAPEDVRVIGRVVARFTVLP